ncbi:MAG: hypothetical protein PUI46_06190 [Lachnospiraceae bacterium]|nr:hypothetical protein [Lachnospiraceae bacterium]
MNDRKMTLGKLHNVLYILLILFSMLQLKEINIGGISLYLLLSLLTAASLICLNVRRNAGTQGWLKWRINQDWILMLLLGYALIRFMATFFNVRLASGINLEFFILLFISCLVYWVSCNRRSIGPGWLEITAFAGELGSLGILLCFLGVEPLTEWFSLVHSNSGTIASYLILPGILSATVYCFSESKAQRIGALLGTIISFLTLLLNKNHVSLWLMILFFLAIPCIFRPRAEWIKRDMQLLFLFLFLWCNMSLLVNYSEWIKKEVSFNLEASVYGELILAVGGVIFFRHWDQIPEGKDLHRISMVRLQQHFRKLFAVVVFLLVGMIFSGNALNSLPDGGFSGFCKNVFLPLISELQQGGSSFFLTLKELGLVMTLLSLLFLAIIGKRAYNNVHMDKGITNILFILYGIFLAGFFLWDISANVILVYIILLALGSSVREEVIQIKAEKIEIRKDGGNKEHENDE